MAMAPRILHSGESRNLRGNGTSNEREANGTAFSFGGGDRFDALINSRQLALGAKSLAGGLCGVWREWKMADEGHLRAWHAGFSDHSALASGGGISGGAI